jgi:hypothetical protein
MVPRWETTTTADFYGRGPGWKALGDCKMLQKLQRQSLLALDKVVDPPVQQDSSVEGTANTLPGGVSRSSAMVPNAGVRAAYQINPDMVAIENKIEKTTQKIGRMFFADLFLMLIREDNPRMTATEVAERQSEKLQILGPVLERLENELLNPLVTRTFGIMMRNRLLPPPPAELQGQDIKVRYISILAQAQRMIGVTAVQQSIGFIGTALAPLNPTVIDMINVDTTAREYADMLGIPAKMLNSPEKVDEIRKGRAQEVAQMKNLQAAEVAAKAAASGAGAVNAMANAPMNENSALDATLGALTGAQP